MSIFNTSQFNAALFGGAGASPLPVIEVGQGLLYPALRKAGITLGPQRTPSPAQFADAIEELTRLVGSLNIDRYNVYSKSIYTAPLNGGKTYTIGVSDEPGFVADFNVPRPDGIEAANILSNGAPPIRYPLAMLTDLQWSKIQVQDIPNAIPQVMYYDRAYPVATISLWGQPIAGYLLELYCWTPVPTFTSLTDAVLLPDGYVDCLVLNLACRLAPHFQLQVPPDVRQQARESLMRVESINAPKPIADTSALGGNCGRRYNIYSDTTR